MSVITTTIVCIRRVRTSLLRESVIDVAPTKTMPAQWMVYITVADLDQSMESCEERGGKVLVRDRDMGSYGRMSVIQDPAGAVCALMQPPID